MKRTTVSDEVWRSELHPQGMAPFLKTPLRTNNTSEENAFEISLLLKAPTLS